MHLGASLMHLGTQMKKIPFILVGASPMHLDASPMHLGASLEDKPPTPTEGTMTPQTLHG